MSTSARGSMGRRARNGVMDLQPISLARLLDRLQDQNLIERREDPADRRVYRLYLTSSGRALVDDLDEVRTEIAQDVLGGVDDDSIVAALGALAAIREQTRAPRADGTQAPAEAGQTA